MTVCLCGCTLETKINTVSKKPNKFINGHNARLQPSGKDARNYKYGRKKCDRYWTVLRKGHPRANYRGYVYEHILVFEDTYNCCVLPWGVVHHRDESRTNNVWYNLQGMTRTQHLRLHKLGKKRPTRRS
jgi:hypothetical protein